MKLGYFIVKSIPTYKLENFLFQYHWVIHKDAGQGCVPGHESLQRGVCDCVSWILWRLVYGSQSYWQTRYVSVRSFCGSFNL